MPKVFLSYAHVDLGWAKRIYGDLKRYDLEIWFDKESLLPGQDWEKEIRKAIRESDFFMALLSDKCLSKRGFIHSELKFSFEIVERYFPADSGIFIIPVRLDDCKPSDAYARLGRLHWIDVFPESEYENGINKILRVVSPETFIIRDTARELSSAEVNDMLRKHGYFDPDRNPEGKGVSHNYDAKVIRGDKIIVDHATGLMWQQGGSSDYMDYEEAKKWIENLNQKDYAGHKDWRLPTLEEAMSLMDPEEKHGDLYIDPVFDARQRWIWTADLLKGEPWAWVVDFDGGGCDGDLGSYGTYVRAVRSGQSSAK